MPTPTSRSRQSVTGLGFAEAEAVDGRTLTAWPSIRTDLRHAGATVVDKEVVVDGNLITSRKPEDLPAFNRELLGKLGVTMPATV